MRRLLAALALVGAVATPAQAGSWQPHVNGRALSCMAFAATPVDAALCYSGAPRFAGTRPMVFAAPQILAGGFSSAGGSSFPGSVTSGGVILTSATAPAATNAYVNWDGSVLAINAPTAGTFAFKVNGSSVNTFDGNGALTVIKVGPNPNYVDMFRTGTGGVEIRSQQAEANIVSAKADGASAIGTIFNNTVALSTPGAELSEWQNAGSPRLAIDKDGHVKASTGQDLVLDTTDSTRDVSFRIGGSNYLTLTHAGAITFLPGNVTTAKITATGFTPVISGLTESPASATNTALSATKFVHVVTGTTTISTFTGGTEGQLAIVCYAGALTITNSTTDVTNSIHNAAMASGTAPANFLTTSATATNPYCKQYLFTANMPGFTNGQWFEVGL